MSGWIFLLFNVCCVFCNIEDKLNHLQNGFNDAQLDDLIEQLDLRSCSIMIMEPHEKTTMSWNNIKLKLCSKLSCYFNNGDNAINIASGLTLLMTSVDHLCLSSLLQDNMMLEEAHVLPVSGEVFHNLVLNIRGGCARVRRDAMVLCWETMILIWRSWLQTFMNQLYLSNTPELQFGFLLNQ